MGIRGMYLAGVVSCFLGAAMSCGAFGLDLTEAPEALTTLMATLTEQITEDGDFIVVGRVTFDDEALIEDCNDVQANFYRSIDQSLTVYPGGWYISNWVISASYRTDARLVFRAFGYQPQDVVFTPTEQVVVLDEVVLVRDTAYSISGSVQDAEGNPLSDKQVCLSFPFSYAGCGRPSRCISTDEAGQFLFDELAAAEHYLAIAAGSTYQTAWTYVTSQVSEAPEPVEVTLFAKWQIVLEYVYQPDGRTSFIENGLLRGELTWIAYVGGVDFEDGVVEYYDQDDVRDLELGQLGDDLSFRIFYQTGANGIYDAGEVAFETVSEAASEGYQTGPMPCLLDHVYVVRTYEGHYAKFVVRVIEAVPEPS